MHFLIEQYLAGSIEQIEAALIDQAWYEAVSASDADWAPQLLDVNDDGGLRVGLRVRYRFRGRLNAAAARVIDPARLSWVEFSSLDRGAHTIDLRISPDSYADKLTVTASIVLTPGTETTQRVLRGEVKVRVPFVGGRVEGAVVAGLRAHSGTEERVFREYSTRDH